ncbi:FUSC family protein [Sinomonas humi]|nr:FUSC family protein [Sinomonas humi]
MTTFWEADRPLWARVRNSLLVSGSLTLAMAAGVLVAPYGWALVPFSALVILVASVIYHAFLLTRGPSPVMVIYSAVIGAFFGADAQLGWRIVGVTLVASLLTSVFLLVPLVFSPHAPERRALAHARIAVGTYRGLRGNGGGGEAQRLARDAACQAVNNAWLTLHSAWPANRGLRHRELVEDLASIQRGLARAILKAQGDARDLPELSTPAPAWGGRPGWRYLLGHALRAGSVEWFTSWRMAVAAGMAGLISEAVGIGRPYWALMAATIVINQWTDRVAATRKAAHRTVGTLLGVGVVWVVSAAHPSPWSSAAVVVICMVGQYLLLPLNYALALIAITPMALLTVAAAAPGGSVTPLLAERAIDTVIGALSAVAVTWATSWVFPRRLVHSQSYRAAEAVAAVERADEGGTPLSSESRRLRTQLQYELTHHLNILSRAVADDPRLADLASAEHAVADRGYGALARAWTIGASGPDPLKGGVWPIGSRD